METRHQKYQKLKEIIKEAGHSAIAVSGGLDSLFLLRTADLVLGKNVLAIHMSTPYTFKAEYGSVWLESQLAGIRMIKIKSEIPNAILNNPEDRCYLCKSSLFAKIIARAQQEGFKTIMDGTNADDLNAHRPGMKAIKELSVFSPLKEAGFTKAEIRQQAKELGYTFYNQESNSCLLTRLPYNYQVDEKELFSIENAETYLINKGFMDVRFRSQSYKGNIEVQPIQVKKLKEFMKNNEAQVFFSNNGFNKPQVDHIGYISGRRI